MATKVLGRLRDFASIEVAVLARIFTAISEVDYSDSVSRNRIRGKYPEGVGFDLGEYEAEGKLVFSTDEDYRDFLEEASKASPTGGPYAAVFPVSITYSIPGRVLAHDELQTCLIKSLPGGGSTGSALEREVGLDVGKILRDGRNPFGDL
ncbi:MAG: hypothetical protein R3B07_35740 [Polyangiaceae bacterium]